VCRTAPLYRYFPPTRLRSPLGEQEFDPPLVEFNALEYDTSTDKAEDMCKAIGCDIDPMKHTSYDGLHVKHIVGARPGEYLGLRFDYVNLDLGESYLSADLVCLALFPLSAMSARNTDRAVRRTDLPVPLAGQQPERSRIPRESAPRRR
jgi:hypothetical protein